MSKSFVRSSKFRHVFGTPNKKDKCYDNIRISKGPNETNMCAVNSKFVAVVLESQGGGAFLVAPLEKTGRFDLNYPKVCGHKGPVLDVQWNPFNDNEIASCSEDCTVMLWNIPDGGISQNLEECTQTLQGHQRKVMQIYWHPCASNILVSIGADNLLCVWNTSTAEICYRLTHSDTIFSMSWNYDGSRIATTCKDKKIRVFDPRSQEMLSEGLGHIGNKPSRVVYCGQSDKLFTTGFSRSSDRQYGLWDPSDLSRSVQFEDIDSGSGVLFPFYDNSTNVVYLVGKGDTTIKYFEIDDNKVFFLTMFQSNSPQRGAACMPKRLLDHMQCEVMRFFKLIPSKQIVEPIVFTVPRKSEMFQDDIFPPCAAGIPALSADEWIAGVTKSPIMVTITADGLGGTSSGATLAPSKPMIKKQISQGSTSSGGSASRPRSTSPEAAGSGEADAALTKENQRLRQEVHDLRQENSRLTQQLLTKEDTIKKIRQLVN